MPSDERAAAMGGRLRRLVAGGLEAFGLRPTAERVTALPSAADQLQHELAERNRWLISLRWLAATGIIVCTGAASGFLGYRLPVYALITLGVAVAAYNSILRFVERHLASIRSVGAAAALVANLQISLDLVALAVLIHLAGGADNPFVLYFPFHMILAAILLSPQAALGQATLAGALYGAVLLAEHFGVLPHVPVFANSGTAQSLKDVLARIGVLASALYITVFLTASVASRLRVRTRELVRVMEEVSREALSRQEALVKLEQAQRMQLQYMRRVSHEMRSPLASVSLMLKAIRDGLTGDIDPRQREFIERSERRLETLLDMVDDLLTLSRMREAPLQEPKTQIAASYLIDGAVEALADNAQHKGVALNVEIQPGLAPIYGQPDALRTMVLNLVGNAIKYTPSGGSVTISADAGEAPGTVRLRVTDTGMGIAAEDIPRLFDPFFRTEAARHSQIHGTGLGLSIVDLTVKANDGSIAVQSEVGVGTTFEVVLPAAAPSGP